MEYKLDGACSEITQCKISEDEVLSDLWINFNTLMAGLFAMFVYLFYKLSKGLSFFWNCLSILVCIVRGLQTLLRLTSYVWRFSVVLLSLLSKVSWVPTFIILVTGSVVNMKYCITTLLHHIKGFSQSTGSTSRSVATAIRPNIRDPGLRLILIGTNREVCGSLRDSLLGFSVGALSPDKESTSWRAKVDRREVTIIETPDLLGTSLSAKQGALEALRSLQLASPGPHAFLIVLPTTYLDEMQQISVSDLLENLFRLVGEEAAKYVLVAFTCVETQGTFSTLSQLLEKDYLGIKAALRTCFQRAELVNISPGRFIDSIAAEGQRLLERVAEMRAQQGHFIHEFQQKEDSIRKKLLSNMTEQLAQKLAGWKN